MYKPQKENMKGSMFCFQCQESSHGTGCIERGLCGKDSQTANMMDLLMFVISGVATLATELRDNGKPVEESVNRFVTESLYTIVTNTNFNRENLKKRIEFGLKLRNDILKQCGNAGLVTPENDEITWNGLITDFSSKASTLNKNELEEDKEQLSMKELILCALKGMSAYMVHAKRLGIDDIGVHTFMQSVISDLAHKKISYEEWNDLVLITGQYSMRVMSLLDKASTERYGQPEFSSVNISTKNRPGILVSGHDLKDLDDLLIQSEGQGVDIYTHCEMLPAHFYPHFKRYSHFAGNYGNSWWQQREEFPAFHGPILFTGNCLVPPSIEFSYKERIFTTNEAGYPGCRHIFEDRSGHKDFSDVIKIAKHCLPPTSLEKGKISGGFAHATLDNMAGQLLSEYGMGNIQHFFVVAGCDGRMHCREYYTELAKELPKDSVIITAGCAKFRFKKLNMGMINGIPRVLDAGQCNDAYSIIMFALRLKRMLKLDDINDLPISYFISWYEQKSITILLAMLSIGIKNIKLGPTMPAFFTSNMISRMRNMFNLQGISTPEDDVAESLINSYEYEQIPDYND